MSLSRAQILLESGHFAEAEAALGPPNPTTPDPRHAIILARICQAGGDTDRAISVLSEAQKAHPESAPLHLNYAIVANDLGRFAESEAALARVLELQPENDLAHSYHALTLFQLGRDSEGAHVFSHRGFNDNRMFMVRLTEWMETEWLTNGRFFAARHLERPPGPPEPLAKAEIRAREGRAQKNFYAKKYRELLHELDPIASTPHCGEEVLFACALAAEMEFDYALALDYASAIPAETEIPDPIRAVKARALARLNRMEEAAKELNEILIIGPEDYGTNYFLGVVCLAFGERNQARTLFRRAYTDYIIDTLEYQFWQIQRILLAAIGRG